MSIVEKDDTVAFPASAQTTIENLKQLIYEYFLEPKLDIAIKDEGRNGSSLKIKGKYNNLKLNMSILAKLDGGQYNLKFDPGFNTKKFFKDDPSEFHESSMEYLYAVLWNVIYTGFNHPPRYPQVMGGILQSGSSLGGFASGSQLSTGWSDSSSLGNGWDDGSSSSGSSDAWSSPSVSSKGWKNEISHNLQDFRPIIVDQLKGKKIDSINPLKMGIARDKVSSMLKVQKGVENVFGNMDMEITSKFMDESGAYNITARGRWGIDDKVINAKVSQAYDKLEVELEGITNPRLFFDPNIRSYDRNIYEAAALVYFWDLLSMALDIPQRDDVGLSDPEAHAAKSARISKSRSLIVSQIQSNIESNHLFQNQVTGFTDNYEFLYETYNDLFNYIEDSIKFRISNIYRCGYKLNNPHFSKMFIDFEEFDIDSQTIYPCIATYALYFNRLLAREITYIYRNSWVVVQDDSESRDMVNYLNIDSPFFMNKMKQYFEEFRYKYEDKEQVIQRDGKRKSIEYSKELYSLLSIRHFFDEDGKDVFVFIIQQFLRSPKTGFLGLFSSNQLFEMLGAVVTQLERFIVSAADAPMQIERGGGDHEPEEKVQKDEVQPCPFCKWLITSSTRICPRCNKNVEALKISQSVEKQTGASFNKSLALMGAEQDMQSNALLSSIDEHLEEFDITGKEIQQKLTSRFKELWMYDKKITDKILSVEDNTEEIKKKYGAFIKTAVDAPQNYKINPFSMFHLSISELHFNDMILMLCKVKDLYSKYFVPVIIYVCPFPTFDFDLKCTISADGKEIKWSSEDDGDGQVIVNEFNDPEQIIAETLKSVFADPYSYHFMPKKLNILDKLEPVKGMDYILDTIVQTQKITKNGRSILNLCIMYQFLKCDLEDFEGAFDPSTVLNTMDLFYAAINAFVNPEEEMADEPEPEVEDSAPSIWEQPDSPSEDAEAAEESGEVSAADSFFGSTSQEELELDGQEIEIDHDNVLDMDLDKLTRPEIISLCLDHEINPKISDLEEIERQITEINFQITGIKDLEAQADAAFIANQIDFDAYNAQKQQVKEYLQGFEIKIKILQYLKVKVVTDGWN